MTQLLIVILIVLYLQALLIGFIIGLWIAGGKNKKSETVANFFPPKKDVDNSGKIAQPILQDLKKDGIPVRDHPPRSTVTKFPDPQAVRKKKDQETVSAYLEDMQKNKRPGGSFVL